MKLTLRQLQLFLAVSRTQSATKAAEQVALSQSAVSIAISELERHVGAVLFDRVGRKLVLNNNGRLFLPRVQTLMAQLEDLTYLFKDKNSFSLCLGASLTIGNYLLPRLLAQYLKKNNIALGDSAPQAQIMIDSTLRIVDKVVNFEVDCGLVEGVSHRTDLNIIPWMTDQLLLVCSPHHPIIKGTHARKKISRSRLSDTNWLIREQGSGTREILEQNLFPHLKTIHSSLEFSDHEAIKHAAVEGLGVACLSRFVVEDMLLSGQLVELNVDLPQLQRYFYILLNRQRTVTPATERLLEFLIRSGEKSIKESE